MLSVICKAFDHRVNRKRVWHDGLEFRTSSERCGAAMIRGHHGWREFDIAEDADKMRQPNPHRSET